MNGFRNYDSWKLDNNENEADIYQADLPDFFHEDESVLSQFELEVEKLAKSYGIKNKIE